MKIWAGIFATLLLVGCSGSNENAPTGSSNATMQASKPAPDENAAAQFLSTLNKAQDDYHKHTRRYAIAFDELVDAHFLDAVPAEDKIGYTFTMRPAADAESYTVTAKPMQPGSTVHFFFTDQTGVIRAETGKDATASSPKFS